MRLITLLTVSVLLPTLAHAWPWSQDMVNQPSIKPQEPYTTSPDVALIPFPARSVPVSGLPTEVANLQEAMDLNNPIPADEASIEEGKTLYDIYCAACHGHDGNGMESPVGQKMGAADLTSEYVQSQLTEGWIYGTITFGSASQLMPAYGVPNGNKGSNDLLPNERWHVVNYLRHGLMQQVPVEQTTAQADTKE